MFSSTNNLHLFPLQQYFPSSSSSSFVAPPPPPSPSPHHPEPVYIAPQDPILSGVGGPFLQVLPDQEDQARMKNEQQEVVLMSQNGNGQCLISSSGLNNFLTKKATVKKDRHSKIYTAQGLRDRRVRLSIDISRKFFDLQDMLGYDKASKTLDWLLTKSRKAIKELTKSRHHHHHHHHNNNITSANYSKFNFDDSEECEVISNDDDEAEKIILAKSCKKNNNLAFHDVVAKESRAKARARARERTKEKMILSKSQGAILPEILNQQFRSPPPPPPPPPPVIQKAGSDQENNIIGIMWKPSPMITASNSGYQKNLVISKGDTYYNNCNNFYFPSNLPPNWDINIDSFARPQSGFCSIANIDSLPEFQVCAKPWDACSNNQHLH